MNSTPTKIWLPVCLCIRNLSSPATQPRVPCDCTSPVQSQFLPCSQPGTFPDMTSTELLCLHLLLQTGAADPATGSQSRSHCRPGNFSWLTGDSLTALITAELFVRPLPSWGHCLASLSFSLSIHLIFTKPAGIWWVRFLPLCLISSNLPQFQHQGQ